MKGRTWIALGAVAAAVSIAAITHYTPTALGVAGIAANGPGRRPSPTPGTDTAPRSGGPHRGLPGLRAVRSGGRELPVKVFAEQAGPGVRFRSTTWVTRHPVTLSKTQIDIVNARYHGGLGSSEDWRYFDMIAALDVIPPYEAEIDVGIENTHSQPIRVENVRTFAIQRTEPLQGTLICDPTAIRFLDDPAPRILFDLDKANPRAGRYTTAPPVPAAMSVKPGELVDFHVYGTTRRSYVRFRLAFDLVIDGKRSTVKLDNAGQPFEVTGWLDNAAGQFPTHSKRHFHGGYYVQPFIDADHNPGPVRAINPATFKIPPDPGHTSRDMINVCY